MLVTAARAEASDVAHLAFQFGETLCSLLDHTTPGTLGIACSGGSDSLALTLLSHHWAVQNGRKVHAIIVDHGLRNASAKEAVQTKQWLQQHRINATILTLQLEHGSNLQARARAARYQAIVAWCHRHAISTVLLGHHQHDQAETVMMRWLRGSGWDGLAGMSMKRHGQGVTWLRPLLTIKPEILADYLRHHQQAWISDPSNHNTEFTRVRIRRTLQDHAAISASERLADIATRLGTIRHRHDRHLRQIIAGYVNIFDTGVAWIDQKIEAFHAGTVIDILSRLLTTVNGTARIPRHEDVNRAWQNMRAGKPATLHRCLITPIPSHDQSGWVISREPAHLEPPRTLDALSICWDSRFHIECTEPMAPNYTIACLGADGYRQIRESVSLPAPLSSAMAATLPTIWHLEAPVYVPHISYQSASWQKKPVSIRFQPAIALDEPPFFVMNNE